MIKAVIFDVDRTLVDSKRAEYNSFSKAYFKLKGKKLSDDVLKKNLIIQLVLLMDY